MRRRASRRVFSGLLWDYASRAAGDGGQFFVWDVYPRGRASPVLYENQYHGRAVEYFSGLCLCGLVPYGRCRDWAGFPSGCSGFSYVHLVLFREEDEALPSGKVPVFRGNLCTVYLKWEFGIYWRDVYGNCHVCL